MLKDKDKWILAGQIAGKAREYGKDLITEGALVREVLDKIESKIFEWGGKPAFPAQISFNNVAAHNCADPDDKTAFKKGDLLKLDVGVHVDGCIGDTAVTVDLGDNKKLVISSREALDAAIKIARPGTTLGQIGRAIQDSITRHGLSPVKNLSGHGLEVYDIHSSPSIPNFDTGDSTELFKDQVIAIEPFASTGSGMIHETNYSNLFMFVEKKPIRSQTTREVYAEITKFGGLPFTTRWLTKKHPIFKVNYALKELYSIGAIRSFPPLADIKDSMVSQAEHTLIIDDEPIVTTLV